MQSQKTPPEKPTGTSTTQTFRETLAATIREAVVLNERFARRRELFPQAPCGLTQIERLQLAILDDLARLLGIQAQCVQEHLYMSPSLLEQELQSILERQCQIPGIVRDDWDLGSLSETD